MRCAEQSRLASAVALAAVLMSQPTLSWSAPTTTQTTERIRAAVESVRAARPECRSFPAAIIEQYGQSAEDPLLAFERWRRAKQTTLMAPPTVTCGHAAWSVMHRTQASPAEAPAEPSSRGNVHVRVAIAGTNGPLASGLPGYQGEPVIAVDPNNPLRIVAGANTDQVAGTGCQSPTGGASTIAPITLFASPDGGTTWTSTCAPWPAAVTGGLTGATLWFGGDPSVAWDRFGNAYASYLLSSVVPLAPPATNELSSALVVAKSIDGGATWSPLGIVANNIGTLVPFNDKPMLAIDTASSGAHAHPDRLYVVWVQNNTGSFGNPTRLERVAYSDTGATGSWIMASMTEPFVSTLGDNGGDITVAGDGTVYAVWNRFQCQGGGPGYDTDQTLLSSSTDGGATWSAPVVVRDLNFVDFCPNSDLPPQETRGINAFPSIAVDRNPASPFAGRVYVVVMDFPAAPSSTSTRTNIYLYRSIDSGAHWSGPVKVNDDTSTIATQFFPHVAVDQSDGTVSVSWYDTRNSPTDKQTQIYYARSIDGGVTFETNVRVTDGGAQFTNHATSSDENLTDNANANGNQYGDYMGLTVSNRQAHVIWTDSRQFFPTAGSTNVEDVATAVVTNCSPPLWSAPPALACSGTSAQLSWAAPGFGINATGAKYEVDRYTDPGCTIGKLVLATDLATTSYTDASPVDASIVYYYNVVATNNCPGTTLTPMSSASACSAGAGGFAASALITAPAAVCPGSTGNVASLPDNGALAQYSWAATGGAITAGANSRTMTFTAGASGNVHLDSTVALCTGAAAASVDIPISATALAPPSISGVHSICDGYALTLSATPGYASYQWSHAGTPIPGATSATYTKVSTAGDTGNYTVTGTNGCTTSASAPFALTVGAGSSTPPSVTAPAPITLMQTTCSGPNGGVTAATSLALTAFLASGSASEACDPSPARLQPQVGGLDVASSTLFGGGATTVTFRFQDSAGHVGSATSSVNVQLFGDLNLNGVVNSTDLDVLRSYLAGNAHPGTPPFSAPLALADLNGDAAVNAVDAVILAGKLTGSIACLPRR